MTGRPRVHRWTNKSVLALARDGDPVEAITTRARDAVAQALDRGWTGPPFDPIKLAAIMGLEITANSELRDARTVPAARNELRIEFNPSRPRGRMRFSITHEIAHTFFPDCGEKVRNRGHHTSLQNDEWQIEALCNIAATELLMPFGAMRESQPSSLDIHRVLELQRKFDVSTEAVTIRLAETSDELLASFCASVRPGDHRDQLGIDYVISSPGWPAAFSPTAIRLPLGSAVHRCMGVGHSAQGVEKWTERGGRLRVDAVGIPPYPGSDRPRVVGLLRPNTRSLDEASPAIAYVFGDATKPSRDGKRMIVQVVNDKTANWGGAGFASAIRREYPVVQEAFKTWASSSTRSLILGAVHFSEVTADLMVASIVAQHGYGPSDRPRIRYQALGAGLRAAAELASKNDAHVHMPRIGTGHARGEWPLIQEMIRNEFGRREVPVTVYDPPGSTPKQPDQTSLQFARIVGS